MEQTLLRKDLWKIKKLSSEASEIEDKIEEIIKWNTNYLN
jgi:flavodoxin